MSDTNSGSGFDPQKLHPMYWLRWTFTFEWIGRQFNKLFLKGKEKNNVKKDTEK